ncbi:MAG: arginine--tRNA ligase [Ruminococcaceae bacterium]|nr:arginine--tRNA ligase [Oscillospiraceae bacterium]
MKINPIQQVKEEISVLIFNALKKEELDQFGAEIELEKPKDADHGDFATNIAMRLAKPAKAAPRIIAEKLTAALDLENSCIQKVEVAGPGFINFTLKPEWFYSVLDIIQKEGSDYGRVSVGEGKKVMVEFVSANPTGPMHVGNARGGAIGDVLASVLDFAGYDVTREFYINDAGNQIEKFGMSLEARYLQLLQGEDSVQFPEDGYHGEDITQLMRDYIALYGDSELSKSSEERKKALVAFGLEKNIAGIQKTMEQFGVNYDVWFRESELYKSGEVKDTIAQLAATGKAYEQEGATWFGATAFGAEKDEVLVRSNGIPTYFAADIAYHQNKFKTRRFDTVIDVWGADHHGHTARMKGAMDILGINPDRLQFVLMQLVRLMRDGEVYKVSKRTGKAITLNELLEDIGSDAARFFFNLRQPSSHFDFDLDLAVSQTNENPVYYVQYAYARCCSILRMLEAENVFVPEFKDVDCSLMNSPQEMTLLERLSAFPQEITDAADQYEPSKITRYTVELASAFHSFYNANRVKGEDEALMNARLLLIDCVKTTLSNALGVLGVSAPERM